MQSENLPIISQEHQPPTEGQTHAGHINNAAVVTTHTSAAAISAELDTGTSSAPMTENHGYGPVHTALGTTISAEGGPIAELSILERALAALPKGAGLADQRVALGTALRSAVAKGDLVQIDLISAKLQTVGTRQQRRASRDKLLGTLERDPATGKAWAGEYEYDPRSAAMQELYSERREPFDVVEHGGKLIRSDGGKYGLVGGVLRASLAAQAECGESFTPAQLRALTKHHTWDVVERVHGIGAGYTRDATWICWLWSQLKGEPLTMGRLPRRRPLQLFGEWEAKTFASEYDKALRKVGLVAEGTAANATTASLSTDVTTKEVPPTAVAAKTTQSKEYMPNATNVSTTEIELEPQGGNQRAAKTGPVLVGLGVDVVPTNASRLTTDEALALFQYVQALERGEATFDAVKVAHALLEVEELAEYLEASDLPPDHALRDVCSDARMATDHLLDADCYPEPGLEREQRDAVDRELDEIRRAENSGTAPAALAPEPIAPTAVPNTTTGHTATATDAILATTASAGTAALDATTTIPRDADKPASEPATVEAPPSSSPDNDSELDRFIASLDACSSPERV